MDIYRYLVRYLDEASGELTGVFGFLPGCAQRAALKLNAWLNA
jgi:hypothetical protein